MERKILGAIVVCVGFVVVFCVGKFHAEYSAAWQDYRTASAAYIEFMKEHSQFIKERSDELRASNERQKLVDDAATKTKDPFLIKIAGDHRLDTIRTRPTNDLLPLVDPAPWTFAVTPATSLFILIIGYLVSLLVVAYGALLIFRPH